MNIQELFAKRGMLMGHMISYSKTTYRDHNVGNEVYFNANVYSKRGKEWYGDIDLTKSDAMLQEIANEAGTAIYVLKEYDGRFETPDTNTVKKKAVKAYYPAYKSVFDVIGILFKKN